MEILNSRLIDQFIEKHADAEASLKDWITKTSAAKWENNADVQKTFNSADHLGDQKFIFNIGGNNFQLVAVVVFVNDTLTVAEVMTYAEYDRWKP